MAIVNEENVPHCGELTGEYGAGRGLFDLDLEVPEGEVRWIRR